MLYIDTKHWQEWFITKYFRFKLLHSFLLVFFTSLYFQVPPTWSCLDYTDGELICYLQHPSGDIVTSACYQSRTMTPVMLAFHTRVLHPIYFVWNLIVMKTKWLLHRLKRIITIVNIYYAYTIMRYRSRLLYKMRKENKQTKSVIWYHDQFARKWWERTMGQSRELMYCTHDIYECRFISILNGLF